MEFINDDLAFNGRFVCDLISFDICFVCFKVYYEENGLRAFRNLFNPQGLLGSYLICHDNLWPFQVSATTYGSIRVDRSGYCEFSLKMHAKPSRIIMAFGLEMC